MSSPKEPSWIGEPGPERLVPVEASRVLMQAECGEQDAAFYVIDLLEAGVREGPLFDAAMAKVREYLTTATGNPRKALLLVLDLPSKLRRP